MTKTTNLTYSELLEICPRDRPFQIRVQSNPYGKGGEQVLWAECYNWKNFNTDLVNQGSIDGVNYACWLNWESHYKGTFDLIDPFADQQFKKPEVYQAGDYVEVLENTRECGGFEGWASEVKEMVGGIFEIIGVTDSSKGVIYALGVGYSFPHYCVKKVEKPEELTLEITMAQIKEKFGAKNIKIVE